MYRIKKVVLSMLFAGIVALPAGLYGQDNNMQGTGADTLETESTDQTTETSTEQGMSSAPGFSVDEIDQAFARLDESPSDNVKSQHEGIAESHARDLQTKLGLEDDSFNKIKDAINSYLEEGWSARVKLAQETGNPESYQDESADLAYLRVDLAENIKGELGETGGTQWNSHAVDFWTSLDKADFEVKAREAGISTGAGVETEENLNQNEMNQDQMNMENDQQNMNETQPSIDQNDTEENQSDLDENTDESATEQDENTESESPDQE